MSDGVWRAICDALGIDSTPGGFRKAVVQSVLEHALVVPYASPIHHNYMI